MPADSGAGWPILAELCLRLQPLRVLVLADHLLAPMPEGGLPEKVRGLLAKTCSSEALEAAIRLVLAGGECFPSHAPVHRVHEPLADALPVDLSRLVATPVVVPLHGADAAAPAHADTHAVPTETPAAGAHLLNITERQYEVLACWRVAIRSRRSAACSISRWPRRRRTPARSISACTCATRARPCTSRSSAAHR
jgi:DNA-binding NarL/FixJ family response regulator